MANLLRDDNIVSLVQEALDLSLMAHSYDIDAQYVDACDYYDKTILHIDEALNKIPIGSEEYQSLLAFREKYENRLEILRAHETSRGDIGVMSGFVHSSSSSSGSGGGGSAGGNKNTPGAGAGAAGAGAGEGASTSANAPTSIIPAAPVKRRMSRIAFDEEMDPQTHCAHERTSTATKARALGPVSVMRQPYGTLRLIRTTIETGGFLTGSLYVPRVVWKQFGVKLSGISIKMSAFEALIGSIESYIEPLCFPDPDAESISDVSQQFHSFLVAINNLQNSLSKPFPFIRESHPPNIKSGAHGGGGGGGAGASESAGAVSSDSGGGVGSGSSGASSGSGASSSSSSASSGKGAGNTAGSSDESSAQVQKWTSYVAGFGKSMVKYAEVGYQRFGAMTTRVSDEEFAAYTTMLLILCEKCQILDKWYDFLEKERERALFKCPDVAVSGGASGKGGTKDAAHKPSLSERLFNTDEAEVEVAPEKSASKPSSPPSLSPEQAWWLYSLEGLLVDMMSISLFIKEVVVEIIVRDVEILLKRYMKKMRKSFGRMHWDDADEVELDN